MYVDNPFINPTTISFCTGYGGLDAGVEHALGGSRTAAYVEIEAAANFFLAEQMEKGLVAPAPIWTDVKSFNAEPFRDRIHGITAGYPCQPFSVAGGRGGEDDPRHLFPHLRRSYNTIRPVWCFFENVRGHLSMGFDEVYRSLRADGYAVEFGIFSAEEVGATHQRERLFILAIRQDWLEYASKQGLQITGYGGLREYEKKTGRRLDRRSEFSGNDESQLADTKRSGAGVEEHRGGGQKRKRSGSHISKILRQENGEISSKGTDSDSFNELDDSDLFGERSEFGNLREEDGEVSQRNDNAEPFNSDQINMANPGSEGLQGCEFDGTPEQEFREPGSPRPISESDIYNWPMPPGPYQWDWEAQRAVKPGVGCTIDGFNFREDLLRLLGNGVVPQTAALAFQVLLRKFKL